MLEASEPVAVAQILVSQEQVDGPYTGDPSLTIFPAVDQFRRNYLFAVPTSWDTNYIVISMPKGTNVTIDGAPIPGFVRVARRWAPSRERTTSRGRARSPQVRTPWSATSRSASPRTATVARARTAFVGGANVTKIYVPPVIR